MKLFLIISVHLLYVQSSSTFSVEENKKQISNIFEGFGYSHICVASALATCERVSRDNSYVLKGELLTELIMAQLKDISCCKRQTSDNSFSISIINTSLEMINKELQEVKNALTSCVNDQPRQRLWKNLDNALQEFKTAMKKTSNCSSMNELTKTYENKFVEILNYCREEKLPQNCAEIRALGYLNSAVRTIYPYGNSERPIKSSCDQTTDGGGWTVIQNRDALPIRENFYRTWNEYVNGFGDVSGEFWLGLNNIHAVVKSTKRMVLRVDLEDYEGGKRWAKYDNFYVGDVSTNYSLSIGTYSGDAGDCLKYHNFSMFSTYDQDNDASAGNCAKIRRGAWWYNDCTASNLNGFQYAGNHSSYEDGVNWDQFRGSYYSLKRANMKIRPFLI